MIREYVTRFWRILLVVDTIFQEFRSGFIGKNSPVHFFWGSFDLAVTRFSGRRAPQREGADPITREAYSHEVISAGFWPGGGEIKGAAFYAYASPEPAGYAQAAVRPGKAFYHPQMKEFFLMYDDVRTATSPRTALLEFLESTYEAGANLAKWDRSELERAPKILVSANLRLWRKSVEMRQICLPGTPCTDMALALLIPLIASVHGCLSCTLNEFRMVFRYLSKVTGWPYHYGLSTTMATPTLIPKTSDTVQALMQLLRSRSSEEIRQRMYDNPPGSPWWAACKTELDLRNSERSATALVDTSRVLDKLRSATDHLDELTGRLLQSTTDMAEVVKSVRESGRRMEIATYVIVGLTIVQLFYIAFQFSAKH